MGKGMFQIFRGVFMSMFFMPIEAFLGLINGTGSYEKFQDFEERIYSASSTAAWEVTGTVLPAVFGYLALGLWGGLVLWSGSRFFLNFARESREDRKIDKKDAQLRRDFEQFKLRLLAGGQPPPGMLLDEGQDVIWDLE